MKRIKVVEKRLGRERAWGLAYPDGVIEVDPRQSGKPYLDTLLHEALHILFPRASERKVAAAARELTRLAWLKGYRRTTK